MVGVISKAPKRYFSERISDAMISTGLELSNNAQDYLSSMLVNFIKVENFSERPLLAKFLLDAEKTTQLQGAVKYIHIGDSCLFVSSFLDGYVNRKMKDIGYCIQVGEYSYGKAAVLFLRSPMKESANLFSEMEGKFRTIVDIVAETLGNVEIKESDDIAYLIERYLATKNKDALRRLAELGINIPDFSGTA